MKLQRVLASSAVLFLAVGSMLLESEAAGAQPSGEATKTYAPDSEYYAAPVTPTEQYTIAQQKAITRGKNRLARLEIQRRHGLVPGRPDAVVVPWTSATSLTWTRPRAGMFVYNSGYYRPYYHYSYPYGYPYTVRR